jgi:hypothetical protein
MKQFRYPWIPVGVLVAVGWLALLWAQMLATGLVHFPSRAVVLEKTPNLRTEQYSRQVVLVVAPGLKVADLAAMPVWQELAPLGASGVLQAVLPSFTWPNEAAIVTGAPPWVTGVLTDLHAEPVTADSLFGRVPTAVVGSFVWDRLFPGQVSRSAAFPPGSPDADRVERGLHWIQEGFPLVIIELNSGDPKSLDAQIVALSQALDLKSATLVVVSPRGESARGGFGGSEPSVAQVPVLLLGAGVQPAKGLHGKMLDLAPTLTSLLGVPPPAHSLGKPLGVPAEKEMIHAQQRKLADASLLAQQLPNAASADPVQDLVAGMQGGELRSRLFRLFVWVLAFAGTATLLARLDRRRGWKAVTLGLQWGAIVTLTWNLTYLVLIGPYSPSRLGSWEQARLMGLFCGLLGFLLVLLAAGLRGAMPIPGRPSTGGLEVAAGTVMFMGFQALLYGALYGFPRPVSVPRADVTLALAALLAGLLGVCLAAPLTPWVSRLAGRWPVRRGRVGKVTA